MALAVSAPAMADSALYNFLDIPTSAHSFAMGGINTALLDRDITLASQNPALVGNEIGHQCAVGYMRYMSTGNFGSAHIGMAAGERGAWVAGIRYLDYGNFDGYTPDGTGTGLFKPIDMAFEGTYSHDITDRLRGGINVKMLYSRYEIYDALALGIDLGLNYYNEESDMSFSFVMANMGGQIKRLDQKHNALPFDIRMGYMQSLGETPFQLSINAVELTRWHLPYYEHQGMDQDTKIQTNFTSDLFRHLIFGLQYAPTEKFYLAGGYNYRVRTDMSDYQRNILSGFSVGGGLNTQDFGVDIAYAMPNKATASLLFNFKFNF